MVNETGAEKVETEEQARRAAQHLRELQSLFFAPAEAIAGFRILFPKNGVGAVKHARIRAVASKPGDMIPNILQCACPPLGKR